ncbi:hypothetical protein BGZ94_004940, partial [Podila epigama]
MNLQESDKLLKRSVNTIDIATQGFPRLKITTDNVQHYELVTEEYIARARAEVSKNAEPMLLEWIDKATQIVVDLEAQEFGLQQQCSRMEE